MRYKAVLFDLGGVVVGSPLAVIARYEAVRGIPAGFLNRVVVTAGAAGAWARLERGEILLEAFYPAFEEECAAAGCSIDAREMMARVSEVTVPRPAMLEAIRRLRPGGTPPPSKDRHGKSRAAAVHSARGFPIGAHTGPSAGRRSAGDRGREPASAVGLPAAGLGPAWSSRRKKGGDPVTYSPTVICEVVPS